MTTAARGAVSVMILRLKHFREATMPAATYLYVYFAGGKHNRKNRPPGAAAGGFTFIKPPKPGGMWNPGDPFPCHDYPQTEPVNGVNYNFSYMTVSGCVANGAQTTSFDCTTPPIPMPPNGTPIGLEVGTAPITVVGVYVPPSVVGLGGGVSIDAFDETTGTLFNDDFVSVSPDSHGVETQGGNNDGYVDTKNAAETITALSPTSPTAVNFTRWVRLGPPANAISNKDLVAQKGDSFAALAFYVAPPQEQTTCTDALASLDQLLLDQNPQLTGKQWTDAQALLSKCVAQGFLPAAKVNNAIQQYNHLLETKHNPPPPKIP
jgi:hypothetical protein